jgi:hypothetical protein
MLPEVPVTVTVYSTVVGELFSPPQPACNAANSKTKTPILHAKLTPRFELQEATHNRRVEIAGNSRKAAHCEELALELIAVAIWGAVTVRVELTELP